MKIKVIFDFDDETDHALSFIKLVRGLELKDWLK